jgi:isocitrate dehydrogenase kinase/phosphatase
VGRIINGLTRCCRSRADPHAKPGLLALDTALLKRDQLLIIFSFSHSYFLVDMEVPSAYVQFLGTMMPGKPKAEIYTSVGLQKQGKNLFYRDLLTSPAPFERQVHHRARHQGHGDAGVHAAVVSLCVQADQGQLPAAEGNHARTDPWASTSSSSSTTASGRMADTLEYSSVALPRRASTTR